MPRAVREQQMLDAAVRIFGQRGYRAASMDEIADVAGVSKPLVYLYLNSKEELFTACIRREAAALVAAVRAGVSGGEGGGGVRGGLPADRQLWAGLQAFFTHTAERPDAWVVLHNQARTQGEPFAAEVAVMREEIVAFVTSLIAEAAREAHRKPELAEREVAGLAQALVGAAESLAGWANGDASVSAKEAAATLMNFAWAGLGELMEGRRWVP
ncbi:TetR/AcrR family transcriptional regulator [Streptomyces durmitorensis]|uniref:TetR/AcrR family transcriptional regulator n=1 Tax=Streptomyces durmitorensis TaxID=319947 RepID=A0ABY4Q8X7_9ACTN|nr:TetR/AcrR family transcriptional regulator [Streptomyces durmitorensis]UQT61584.1 TetR/AcrR family transcriptional regulator [Streptomyces durmitorensis]